MSTQFPLHNCYEEPELVFSADNPRATHIHPLRGLVEYGPYTKNIMTNPIRIATIAPNGESSKLYDFIKDLNSSIAPKERRSYVPNWLSFENVFRVKMRRAGGECHIELDTKLDEQVAASNTPHLALSDAIERAIQRLDTLRSNFDVVFLYLPVKLKKAFKSAAADFDLHDHLKAITALRAMPLQVVREDSAIAYSCRASVMWRIGLALYAKAGGVPWKLAEVNSDTAYVGISYAVRFDEQGKPQFVTCCSQVFDAQGSGLEFVAFDAREANVVKGNPFLSKNEMFRVMTRSLDLYRARHAGHTPKKIIVHKTTEFKPEEVDGCMQAFHLCDEVDLIQIVESSGWRGIRVGPDRKDPKKAVAASFPVPRGSLVTISKYEALLWMHGDVVGIDGNKPYFQGQKSIPRPLKLIRWAGRGSWDQTARAALALSKMDWNNDSLYDHIPVTLRYADVLAQVIKRMERLGTTPYQFRFFM